MNYHNITKNDMLNGSGLRVVLWVSGCEHRCVGCHNPETWDINSGIPFDINAENELFEALNHDYISGITFSGGDPLHIQNRSEIRRLINRFKKEFPNKNIWLYTGYLFEDIKDLDFIEDIDVLCDGRFSLYLKDENTHWVGSTNQRVIDIKETLDKNRIVLYN